MGFGVREVGMGLGHLTTMVERAGDTQSSPMALSAGCGMRGDGKGGVG